MKLIDYTDMLWLISRWDLQPWQRDILLVDECHLASRVQGQKTLGAIPSTVGRILHDEDYLSD